MSEKQALNILYPPEFIFEYVRPRIDPSMQTVHEKEQGMFEFAGVKYPALLDRGDDFYKSNNLQKDWFKYPVVFSKNEKGEGVIQVRSDLPPITEEEKKMGGQLVWFNDCPYPMKGHPFPQAIFAVNQAKRLTRCVIDGIVNKSFSPFYIFFIFFPHGTKIKIIEQTLITYSEVCRRVMETYVLRYEFMTKYGQELWDFIKNYLIKIGIREDIANEFAKYFSSQIDWDNAYWMRIGDTLAETTKEKLMANPRKEFLRLADIMVERNPQDIRTATRFKKLLTFTSYIFYVPFYGKKLRECIDEMNLSKLQFDAADRYHSLVYGDYDYLGLPVAKRLEMWFDYHKEHPPLPKRITITP